MHSSKLDRKLFSVSKYMILVLVVGATEIGAQMVAADP